MNTDICICTKTRADHDISLPATNGACLDFTLDRKATYWAEKRAAALTRSAKLAEDIKAGRVRPIVAFEQMVTREPATPEAGAKAVLGELAARLGLEAGS